jgi:hypothetical protein
MPQTLIKSFKAAHAHGFTDTQIKNICIIIFEISPLLTGEIHSCSSGSGFNHLALQLKGNKWLMFHCVSGDVTVTSRQYKTFGRLYKAFWDYPQYVTMLYVETGHEKDQFNEPEKIANRILNNEFKNSLA